MRNSVGIISVLIFSINAYAVRVYKSKCGDFACVKSEVYSSLKQDLCDGLPPEHHYEHIYKMQLQVDCRPHNLYANHYVDVSVSYFSPQSKERTPVGIRCYTKLSEALTSVASQITGCLSSKPPGTEGEANTDAEVTENSQDDSAAPDPAAVKSLAQCEAQTRQAAEKTCKGSPVRGQNLGALSWDQRYQAELNSCQRTGNTPYFCCQNEVGRGCPEAAVQQNRDAATAADPQKISACQNAKNRYISKTYNDQATADELYERCLNPHENINWDEQIEVSNQITRDEITAKYQGAIDQCKEDLADTQTCCGEEAQRCIDRAVGINAEDKQFIGAILQAGAAAAVNLPAQTITAQCSRMSKVGYVMAGLNTGLAETCRKSSSQCKNSCGGTLNKQENDEACKKGFCTHVAISEEAAECESLASNALNLFDQAGKSVIAAQAADFCKKQAEGQNSNHDQFANQDCTAPGASSSAYCQQLCNRAGAQSDPNCAQFFNGNGTRGGAVGGSAGGRNSVGGWSGFINSLIGEDEGEQTANIEDVEAKQQKSTGSPGGGGSGGVPGGGGGAGGSDDSSGGYAGGGDGYNTGILQGTRSGDGYTQGRGVASGGSGFGYGASGGAITSKNKPFNLRDFLPGGKKNQAPSFRGIASLARDISPAHADIFKKMTDRYVQVCLRDALYDCPRQAVRAKRLGN